MTGQPLAKAPERNGQGASLDPLVSLVREDMERVNALILEHMQSPVALIPQLAGHIIAAGGKRLRPMLTLATARMFGYTGTRHHALAACVEFIHTATLLHDDVVDDSELRRGRSSANTLWGNEASVLVGDFLFSRAFELMVRDGSLAVLAVLSEASSVIAEGEVHQLLTTNDTDTTEETYLTVIGAKTAKLFAAASRVGAIVAERSPEEEAAVERFGHALGIAFQLIDDVLDYDAEQAALGKTVGDDFREGKVSLPVILAHRGGDAAERAFWRRTVGELDQQEGDLARAQELMRRHGALQETTARARAAADEARAALAGFPDVPARAALLEALDFCIERAY